MSYGEKHLNLVSKGPVKGMQWMLIMHDLVKNVMKIWKNPERQTPMREKRMEMEQCSSEEELANLQSVSHSHQISSKNNVTHHEVPSDNRNR